MPSNGMEKRDSGKVRIFFQTREMRISEKKSEVTISVLLLGKHKIWHGHVMYYNG